MEPPTLPKMSSRSTLNVTRHRTITQLPQQRTHNFLLLTFHTHFCTIEPHLMISQYDTVFTPADSTYTTTYNEVSPFSILLLTNNTHVTVHSGV
jgi:hypothetical protein